MRDQFTLLCETDWDVLVILDACRADAFREIVGKAEVVRSPAPCTRIWLKKMRPLLEEEDIIYFSGNPLIEREVEKQGLNLRTVPIWKRHWGYFTPLSIPSVHPMSVTSVVLDRLLSRPIEPCRLVVHYSQPHSPYIGAVPLKLARSGNGKHGLHHECHLLQWPDRAVREGRITWEQLREAYHANLALAWEAVRVLIAGLGGRRIVVTSDHGEVLGEHGGKFGHECNWPYDELHRVPWLELLGGESEESTVQEKLEALGYLS